MNLITTHPIVALVLVSLFVALITLVVGGIMAKQMPKQSEIEPGSLSDGTRCAWCDMERARKGQPHESHSICQRHKEQMLQDAKRINQAA